MTPGDYLDRWHLRLKVNESINVAYVGLDNANTLGEQTIEMMLHFDLPVSEISAF